MIKLCVNKGTVEKAIQGKLDICLTELIAGNLSVLKDISRDVNEYDRLVRSMVCAMLSIEYNEIQEAVTHE